ncbi:protein [Escherichia coli]|uniref:Protein n=1 Tax=Escherichia coli TaxID=562 RepID=A0A377AMY2_ECOLX|nr:protein [Escherichia coli]
MIFTLISSGDINYGKGDAYVSLGHHISGYRVIAAALGFGGLAGTAAGAAKIVFVVGIILFLVSLFMGRKRP